MSALQPSHKVLFEATYELIEEIAGYFSAHEQLAFDANGWQDLREQVSQPFSIFVCGEFNSGKSSLINQIAGEHLSLVGILPTTTEVQAFPSANIAGLVFVDSPGTNSIIEEHQVKTENYIRRADFVLFVTSIERPLADSEVKFLRVISEKWKRKVVVAVNKTDLLDETKKSAQTDEVVDFVLKGIKDLLSIEPPCFAVSARTGEGVSDLASYLFKGISATEKIKIKLLSPLDTARIIMSDSRKSLLLEKEKIEQDLLVYERIFKRAERRIEEANLYFDGFGERVKRTTAEISSRLIRLIDERFAYFSILRTRIFGNQEAFKSRVYSVLEETDFEKKLHSVVEDAAARVVSYREIIYSDLQDYLETMALGEAQQLEVLELKEDVVDTQAIAEDLKARAEAGLNKFLAFGSAAAASGISAKLATVGSIEITAALLMAALAALSLRALPAERNKAKKEIEESFREIASGFALSLTQAIEKHLQDVLVNIQEQLKEKTTVLHKNAEQIEEVRAKLAEFTKEAGNIQEQVIELSDPESSNAGQQIS